MDSIKALRITVIGPSAAGKTCLINAWINNSCPMVYTPTDDPTLYYRTLRAEKDEELCTVMVEVEDTYCSDRTDGKDRFARNRSIQNFIVMKKTTQGPKGSGGIFSNAHAPKESVYDPFSKGRMAFMVVFDINDRNSFVSAEKACWVLNERHKEKVGTDMEPVVYLVANKIDQDPLGEEPAKMRRKVESWRLSHDHQLPFRFMDVSALEFTRVRKLFRNIVDELLQRPKLYDLDEDTEEDENNMQSSSTWFGGASSGGGAMGAMTSLFSWGR